MSVDCTAPKQKNTYYWLLRVANSLMSLDCRKKQNTHRTMTTMSTMTGEQKYSTQGRGGIWTPRSSYSRSQMYNTVLLMQITIAHFIFKEKKTFSLPMPNHREAKICARKDTIDWKLIHQKKYRHSRKESSVSFSHGRKPTQREEEYAHSPLRGPETQLSLQPTAKAVTTKIWIRHVTSNLIS